MMKKVLLATLFGILIASHANASNEKIVELYQDAKTELDSMSYSKNAIVNTAPYQNPKDFYQYYSRGILFEPHFMLKPLVGKSSYIPEKNPNGDVEMTVFDSNQKYNAVVTDVKSTYVYISPLSDRERQELSVLNYNKHHIHAGHLGGGLVGTTSAIVADQTHHHSKSAINNSALIGSVVGMTAGYLIGSATYDNHQNEIDLVVPAYDVYFKLSNGKTGRFTQSAANIDKMKLNVGTKLVMYRDTNAQQSAWFYQTR